MKDYIITKLRDASTLAENYTSKDGERHKHRYIFYRLKMYLDRFLKNYGKAERWIILYGLRGIGKTTLMFQIYQEIRKTGISPNEVLYLSADELITYSNGNLAQAITTYVQTIQG